MKTKSTTKATPKLKPTVVTQEAPPKSKIGVAFDAAEQELEKQMEAAMHSIQRAFDFLNTSWTRKIVAFTLVCIASAGLGYLIGTLGAYLIVGAVTLGAGAFLTLAIYTLTILLSIYAGMKAAQYVGNYVLDGTIDKHLALVGSKIKGIFKKPNFKRFVPSMA